MDDIDKMCDMIMANREAERSLFRSIIAENGNRTDIVVRCAAVGYTRTQIIRALREWTAAGELTCEERDGQVFYAVVPEQAADEAKIIQKFVERVEARLNPSGGSCLASSILRDEANKKVHYYCNKCGASLGSAYVYKYNETLSCGCPAHELRQKEVDDGHTSLRKDRNIV